tara:strand:+ start:28745 stop:29746 length:1002 start_codon:yes stop_codon:yes gene_type:complete
MSAHQTKIVRFHESGNAEVLKFDMMPLSDPGENEIRIRVEAIGLNRAEIMFRESSYLEMPVFPSRLGYEASGTVEALGASVSGFSVGDRVSTIPAFSMGEYGVYGETAIVPASAVAHYPDNLSTIEGTSIWMQYITAYGALIEIANLEKGGTILLTAASSSVGIAAIQIAKMVEATVIAVTRTKNKKGDLLKSGADYVIVTDEQDLAATVSALTEGKGFDLAFDPIGGPMLTELAEAAAGGSTIIEYGALSPEQTVYPLFLSLEKGLSIRGYVLFEVTQCPEKLSKAKQFISAGLESGKLKPLVDRVFSFDEIADAQRYMESNEQMGKIVVTV